MNDWHNLPLPLLSEQRGKNQYLSNGYVLLYKCKGNSTLLDGDDFFLNSPPELVGAQPD
jgi:hypothetical protein